MPTLSTESNKTYYRINVAKDASGSSYQSTYNISPTSSKVSVKNASTDEEKWYFLDAYDHLPSIIPNSHMERYCYIVNAKSGGYLYYTGTTTMATQSDVIEMKAKDAAGTEADRFKFGIVKSPNTTTDTYVIYPKILGENNRTSLKVYNTNLWLQGKNNGVANLSINVGNNWNSQYKYITVDDPSYGAPTINNDNGTVSISVAGNPADSRIYYTTDGTTPSVNNGTLYSSSFSIGFDTYFVKAISYKYADGHHYYASAVSIYEVPRCATPEIVDNNGSVTITCTTAGATIYYTTTGSDPVIGSSTTYSGGTLTPGGNAVVKALAVKNGYCKSYVSAHKIGLSLNGAGTAASPYLIASDEDFANFASYFANNPNDAGKVYRITANINASEAEPIESPFTGTFEGQAFASGDHNGEFPVISGLSYPLFNIVTGGIVRNVMLKDVNISQSGKVGGIAGIVNGDARIYNCGVLPSNPNLTTASTIGSTNDYCGGIVGLLDGTARVVNCFSFANITGGTTVAGIVGYNNTSGATQSNYSEKTVVVNCMFYGEISGGNIKYPVYGGNVIANDGSISINNYNYYRGEATFDDSYGNVNNYNRSWPAEERNLCQFEYYRSILNSNRRLCTFWITDKQYGSATNASTTDDEALMAKWVVDRSIAPYPVLKKWGKYPSIINPDPDKVWDTIHNQWVQRTNAAPYQGKKLETLNVTIRTGVHPGETGMTGISVINDKSWPLTITDMDTLNHDYCYYKVQLPYYNEVFGNPNETTDHIKRYYGNYTDKVVTGWKIISVNNNDQGTGYTFNADWQAGCNFANRADKYKDLQAKSGRVFAQGGYYYVPEGVTSITIEACWGTAFYMHGKGHSVDRVSVCTYDGDTKNYGYAFSPAGTLPNKWVYNDMTIYDDLNDVVKNKLSTSSATVYDQAIVLVGNFPVHAQNDISLNYTNGKKVTFMSADLDMDNEPDFCMPLQWRNNYDRRPILPVRFDFLPIPELGLAMRHNTYAYAIGIMVPLGHFEITETSFMHTTQFEYMATNVGNNHQQPLIFNGGQFEQIVVKGTNFPEVANTRNIIMGGHVWMKRFTPGGHAGNSHRARVRHCAVSVMGGEYPEFYLSGLYRTDVTTSNAYNDNPHCYTNGGRFGIMAGAGMEAVRGNVFFEIDHSIIREFYGGGINGNVSNRVNGSISVVINNSLVLDKYCGGPKVGVMNDGTTVTTSATGTIFNQYFGGGNGGTNLYRQQIQDATPDHMPDESDWSGSNYGWSGFTPISSQGATATYDATKGYHAEFEFEVFNQSNGINDAAVARSYIHYAQFGTTITGDVSNTLVNCTMKHDFYGGGNLGNVSGKVESTLTDCTIMGSAFGGGYSASIPEFSVHDKSKVSFPYRDAAGVCHNGTVGYRTDGEAPNEVIRKYTWCYKNPTTNVVTPSGVTIPSGVNTSTPAFQDDNGKWYCYTTVSLEDLGAIGGNVILKLKGNTTVGTMDGENLVEGTGNVFGGGDESTVEDNTTVILEDGTTVRGNVYGGGNEGPVSGDSEVIIKNN